MLKRVFAIALITSGALMSVMPLPASAQYTAVVRVAPPPPIPEEIPEPRRGFVWTPGYYEWRGNGYVWTSGQWVAARPGYEFREPRWIQRGNGEWYRVGGNWESRGPYGDRDRDGIRNRNDRDRDGDGVSNRRDRYPDNPRRN